MMSPTSGCAFVVEMSGHDMVCFDKTFEAAEALLHMESPGLHPERNSGQSLSSPPHSASSTAHDCGVQGAVVV